MSKTTIVVNYHCSHAGCPARVLLEVVRGPYGGPPALALEAAACLLGFRRLMVRGATHGRIVCLEHLAGAVCMRCQLEDCSCMGGPKFEVEMPIAADQGEPQPCTPYPEDASYKTVAIYCPRCDTNGECWRRYLSWEKSIGVTLNADQHPEQVDEDHRRLVDCDCTVCAYSKKHPQLNAPRCR